MISFSQALCPPMPLGQFRLFASFACCFACILLVGGCVSTSVPPTHTDYVFVILKTGPQSDAKTPDERQEIFAGHMSNMRRLADRRQLLIAGPFDKPHDPTWRGVFVLDNPNLRVARSVVNTDPGVVAGVFEPDFRRMQAPASLRQLYALNDQETAARAAAPTEPPPNIRAYVMLTADDADRAERVLAASTLADKVVWKGRFTDSTGGVWVLDSTSVEEVHNALPADALGPAAIDAWWSTGTLTKLPKD